MMGPLTSSGIYSENEHIGFSLIKLMLKIIIGKMR
jgi:hypothetical protein